MSSCIKYNQYADELLFNNEGNVIKESCFDGKDLYSEINNTYLNDHLNYKSKKYYSTINSKLGKYEFNKNYIDNTFTQICNNSKYSLKEQQKFAGRVFNTHTSNRGILIYHGLGSGKTQTSIVIAESFKYINNVTDTNISDRINSHVLVVVPASLLNQYFEELIGTLLNDTLNSASGEIVIDGHRQYYQDLQSLRAIYTNEKEMNESLSKLENTTTNTKEYRIILKKYELAKQRRDRLSTDKYSNILKNYIIVSHETFINNIDPNTGKYSSLLKKNNGLLIIDEAHKLVSLIGSRYRRLLLSLKYHSSDSFKIVLLTGTPIYDKPYEIGLLINLLKPRIPFPDGMDKFNEVFIKKEENTQTMINKELFSKMISGYVSYFKGGNPNAYPYKKVIIMKHLMSDYQYTSYKKELLKELDRSLNSDISNNLQNYDDFLYNWCSNCNEDSSEQSTSIFNNSRLRCNIVFPTDLSEDLLKQLPIQIKSQSDREKVFVLYLKNLKRILLRLKDNTDFLMNEISKYSSKFKEVVLLVNKSEGPVFIYSNYVYYGVEAMALILDVCGYTKFKKGINSTNSYFIWSGSTDKEEVNIAKRVFNSESNADGSKLKVILGTQSTMEGVDFKRIRQVHILDPWWNDSRIQQIMARAVRLCSHLGLPPDKQVTDVFIHLSTLNTSESNNYIVELQSGIKCKSDLIPINYVDNIKNHQYLGIFKANKKQVINVSDIKIIKKIGDPEISRIGPCRNLDIYSVEEYMYNKSILKNNINRQFEKVIKENSIDCTINKYGNILRLEEKYEPYIGLQNVYKVEYENSSTGKRYIRKGLRSTISNLPDSLMTLTDIINNTAMKSTRYEFTEINGNSNIITNSSLIVIEDLECNQIEYSFSDIPSSIRNVTLNTQLIPQLNKLNLEDIKRYFINVVNGNINTSTPNLKDSIRKLIDYRLVREKQQIINELNSLGLSDENIPLYEENIRDLRLMLKAFKNFNPVQ